jgi:hypothetical protein
LFNEKCNRTFSHVASLHALGGPISGNLLLIAFVSWDTGLDSSSPKIEPYRFGIIGCISQNFPWFVSRSSSAALDSYAINNGLFKPPAVMLFAWTTTKLIGSELELTAA